MVKNQGNIKTRIGPLIHPVLKTYMGQIYLFFIEVEIDYFFLNTFNKFIVKLN
ncbi:hypothetical protein J588_2433 [Acinetobacter sp. 1578804]|nr:hypothetical protein J588_2433 [Acinetobacter sp. 1578804]EXR43572.1 hypothetical protein J655_0643 [Acinetobacter sp. 1294243]KCX11966.1 hypothetical protein J723_4125 [Acinetobacter sp. 1264765]